MINLIPMQNVNIDLWFQLISRQASEPEQSELPELYIYQCCLKESLALEGSEEKEELAKGDYFTLGAKGWDDQALNPRKLSFTEIVHLTDVIVCAADIGGGSGMDLEEFNQLAMAGKLHERAEEFFQIFEKPAIQIELMKERTAERYFSGLSGRILSIFSSLANFFRKYDLQIYTTILWPGDSCHYADQVVSQIQGAKQLFLKEFLEKAARVNYNLLCEHLKVAATGHHCAEDVKKLYFDLVRQLHPDHNRAKGADAEAGRIIELYQDYRALQRMQELTDVRIDLSTANESAHLSQMHVPEPVFKTSKNFLALSEH
ncbi:hypothetical protein PNK_2460 [Candidatus Protochlamydia naegleriophila]|uniref:J domain-containing protein n=1 Tax=Candidatus Protochlamydia naegleriophila TaxID=389348 RepID=A0A0U5JJS8_9BACT|nr:J domain-containing protein [Candidatus Protochlamydia naegleriophila]CUI18054.1 hypothetical protein PNK_2460 [Candidatus Protochlamydia naegleriophila]